MKCNELGLHGADPHSFIWTWFMAKKKEGERTRDTNFGVSQYFRSKYSLYWWQKSFSSPMNNTLEFQEVVTSVRYMLSVLKIRKASVIFA